MDKYLEAEIALGRAMGMLHVQANRQGRAIGYRREVGKLCVMPRWCRDWSACGPLMVEHGCYPQESAAQIHIDVCDLDGRILGSTEISDHPDRETAVRYCVVMAVIAKLESQKEEET